MRNFNTPMHGTFDDALHRASNGVKRVGGTMLAATMIAAIGFQAAPIDRAVAATQTKQEVNVKATRTKVVDYADGFNGSTPKTLKDHGVKIAVRYVGYQNGVYGWKNLNKSEANALRKQGIDIAAVYETTTSWMSGGYQAGVQAARIAKADIIANGGPKRPFVYFACDEDANYTAQVNAALHGAAHELGGDKVGIYGGYTVVDSALKTHSAAKGWQTEAWSGGRVAKGIALYQTVDKHAGNLGGLDYDSNFAKQDDIGQWGTHAVTKGSAPKRASTAAARAPKRASTGPAVAPKRASTAAAPAPKVASKFTPANSIIAKLTTLFFGIARWPW